MLPFPNTQMIFDVFVINLINGVEEISLHKKIRQCVFQRGLICWSVTE